MLLLFIIAAISVAALSDFFAVDELVLYHKEMNISGTGNYDTTGTGAELTKSYDQLHSEINKNLQKYNDVYGYYDAFIICAAHGHVMYTNAKEADLGTNLSVGEYKNSGLGKLWGEVVKGQKTTIVDLEPYEPSNGVPAMFIGSPLIINGKINAVIALQVNNEKISQMLTNTTGMGDSGEIYCVGKDKLMRTESRFAEKGATSVLNLEIDTTASKVLDQNSGEVFTENIKGYRGSNVLSVFSHARIDETLDADFDWAIIAEIDKSEIMAPVYRLLWILGTIAVVVIISAVVIMTFFSKSISKPIQIGVEAAQQISTGNLKVSIEKKYMARKDEIGLLSNALQNMIIRISEIVSVVVTGSEQIASASTQLSSGNQDLSNRTEQQATALEETSSAIEEMNSSIRSNADNTGSADQLSRDALERTNNKCIIIAVNIIIFLKVFIYFRM